MVGLLFLITVFSSLCPLSFVNLKPNSAMNVLISNSSSPIKNYSPTSLSGPCRQWLAVAILSCALSVTSLKGSFHTDSASVVSGSLTFGDVVATHPTEGVVVEAHYTLTVRNNLNFDYGPARIYFADLDTGSPGGRHGFLYGEIYVHLSGRQTRTVSGTVNIGWFHPDRIPYRVGAMIGGIGGGHYSSDDVRVGTFWGAGVTSQSLSGLGDLLFYPDGSMRNHRLGPITAVADGNWVASPLFGWIHYGASFDDYNGWVYSERFGWMRFTASLLWVPQMRSWMVVQNDNLFHSQPWRYLTPYGMNRYHSSVFGGLTTGDFNGWVHSDRFGWMWANGDSTWCWSQDRGEWLGVTPEGGIWSTAEGRFLE